MDQYIIKAFKRIHRTSQHCHSVFSSAREDYCNKEVWNMEGAGSAGQGSGKVIGDIKKMYNAIK